MEGAVQNSVGVQNDEGGGGGFGHTLVYFVFKAVRHLRAIQKYAHCG